MLRHFDQELTDLKDKLMTMAGRATASVSNSVRALVDRDDARAEDVKRQDDELDRLEMEVDELSIHLLSKAPLATDLRLITVAMKISHDLERVGDEATAIARQAIKLNAEPQLKAYVDITRMTEIALDMLNTALDAFVNRDTAKARSVIPRDESVDALNKQLHRELASYMVEQPATITRCLCLMTVSKRLERIADHATNIAEEVVYLYEAKDIRHGADEEPEAK